MLELGNSGVKISELACVKAPFIPEGSDVVTEFLELPPGDQGAGPHRHSGPVFGYVIEGKILFEIEGEAPYSIEAGQAFWEPGGEVVHYRVANLLSDASSKFVVVMLCAPDVPKITMLTDEEIAERAHLRFSAD
ncbi:cupin [Streptomyces cadmiisoli]|uniref:Cupin n=1 Tax=Streptomyces cadmiisoli TaxID=2184053 RepID=A0A2Z4JAE8_9ACTN|nr:cupin [Streptomyces cadmiisoli]AWW42036.1 cupin [Streptomyces cadmiisoli]